jgi:ubiquinone/menaquinone biosynthesis C-methylase UbiE
MRNSTDALGLRFTFWSSVYDISTQAIGYGRSFRSAILAAMDLAVFPRKGTIVDVGCGTGQLIRAMLSRFQPGTKIIGIDPEPAMLAVAKRNLRSISSQVVERQKEIHVKLVVGHAQHLPLDDASVDAAVMSMTLHHLDRRQKLRALHELHRVLRPGGKLLCVDFGLVPRPGRRSLFRWIALLGFLYFNAIETVAGNFLHMIVDHFTDMLPVLLERSEFTSIKYMEPRFHKAVFLTCKKPENKETWF